MVFILVMDAEGSSKEAFDAAWSTNVKSMEIVPLTSQEETNVKHAD